MMTKEQAQGFVGAVVLAKAAGAQNVDIYYSDYVVTQMDGGEVLVVARPYHLHYGRRQSYPSIIEFGKAHGLEVEKC